MDGICGHPSTPSRSNLIHFPLISGHSPLLEEDMGFPSPSHVRRLVSLISTTLVFLLLSSFGSFRHLFEYPLYFFKNEHPPHRTPTCQPTEIVPSSPLPRTYICVYFCSTSGHPLPFYFSVDGLKDERSSGNYRFYRSLVTCFQLKHDTENINNFKRMLELHYTTAHTH